jgi:hypothetical protein
VAGYGSSGTPIVTIGFALPARGLAKFYSTVVSETTHINNIVGLSDTLLRSSGCRWSWLRLCGDFHPVAIVEDVRARFVRVSRRDIVPLYIRG